MPESKIILQFSALIRYSYNCIDNDSLLSILFTILLTKLCTSSIMTTLLEKLDVSIEYVLVDSMKNETFFSKIALKINNKIEMIDSRASDAIALAVRVSCPIYVNDEVVSNVGVSLDHLAKTAQNNVQKSLNKNNNKLAQDTEVSEFSDFINSLDLDNFGK